MSFLTAMLSEPPLRRFMQIAARTLPVSVRTKDRWNAADRPQYLCGLLYAADQAARQGCDAITAIEFGVAEGYGLLSLERHAAAVERETKVRITVIGFDAGTGLPEGTGDHRDHPDLWRPGDYQSHVPSLRTRLDQRRTSLVLGDVKETAALHPISSPLGFLAVDLDYWSSTVSALQIIKRADVPRLMRVSMYFDDLAAHYNHRWAGELLAIEDFNALSAEVKIDAWRGVQDRPFHEAQWLRGMFIAHDLRAIGATRLSRAPARMR